MTQAQLGSARRMLDAIKQAKLHREEFLAFDSRVRERDPAEVREWEKIWGV